MLASGHVQRVEQRTPATYITHIRTKQLPPVLHTHSQVLTVKGGRILHGLPHKKPLFQAVRVY